MPAAHLKFDHDRSSTLILRENINSPTANRKFHRLQLRTIPQQKPRFENMQIFNQVILEMRLIRECRAGRTILGFWEN